jgi:hypothetical protein
MTFCNSISERSTHELVQAYVLSRRKAKYLSTHLAIRAIRTLSPACAASDQELEDMIETAAIEHGVTASLLRRDRKPDCPRAVQGRPLRGWEQPEFLVSEMRESFRPLRNSK